jgi:cellulose synthase/poly-beta-1,6-N-acetylglucosamine synthase-like glycosyltransferase
VKDASVEKTPYHAAIRMLADPLPILASLAISAASAYAALHAMVLAGLFRGGDRRATDRSTMSVIIAARNEESHLGPLLESLDRQTRRPDEIVIVDDRSEDSTSDVVEAYRRRLPMLKLVKVDTLPAGAAPKKNALERGIAKSSGKVLCFTDADVILPPTWLASIESRLEPRVGVVVGTYTPLPSAQRIGLAGSVLYRFIDYEKYKSWLLSAGAAGWEFAWTASGSNLAYRRSVYDQVGGFSGQHASLSGDDDLFVQRVRRESDWKIVAMSGPEATVLTEVPLTWREFFRQRTRHLSAGRWYDPWSSLWLAVYHASNVAATLSLFAAVAWPEHPFLTAYVMKVSADLILCALGDLRVRRPAAWRWFLPLEFVLAVYLLTAGPASWMKKPSWKEATAAR